MSKNYITNVIGKSLLVFVFLFVSLHATCYMLHAFAQQYGQGTTTAAQLMVDKLVRHPKTGVYVDNLGLSDSKYSAGSTVFFSIVVENTGGKTIDRAKVIDYLPAYVKYVSGGTYNPANRQVTFYFDNLLAGERRSTVLQVKVVALKDLPLAKTVLCPVNKVVASAADVNSDEDTAQFCIEKKAMVVSVPKAGADPMSLFLALSSLPGLAFGLKMRKRG